MNIEGLPNMIKIIRVSFLVQVRERLIQDFFSFTLLIQPILFTIMTVITYLHGGKTNFGWFAIIGTGLIGVWNSNLWSSGAIVSNERRIGTLSLLMVSPTPVAWVLFGKSFANAITSVIAVGISFLIGRLIFGLNIDIQNPPGFFASLLLTILALSCLGMILGSLFVLTRHSNMVLQVANYPVYLLSGLTVPLTLLPLWTRPFSYLLAPMWGNLSLNQSADGSGTDLLGNFVWLVGLSLLYLFIARGLYRVIEYRVRRAGNLEVW